MNIYAIIDNRTSDLWYIVEADNPRFAVYRADAEHGMKYRRYERVPTLAKDEEGYRVYVGPQQVYPWAHFNKERFEFAECFRLLPEN